MARKQLTVTGVTTKEGEFGIYNKSQLNDFCKKNPGKKLIITVQVHEKQMLDAMIAYYYAKVIPEWSQYFRKIGDMKNNDKIDSHLRSISPITKNISSLSILS